MPSIYLLDIEFEFNGQKQTIWPVIIQDESEVILVDCGYPDFLQLLEEAMHRQGIRLEMITRLILTHHDIDHVGSAAALKRKYPNIEIIAHGTETPCINGTQKALRLMQAESTLNEMTGEDRVNAEHFIHFLQSVEPVEVNRIVQSGEFLPWCGGIQIIDTPGHTAGHISLYIPSIKTLIAGDAVVIEDGKLNIANPQYCSDLEEAIRTVQELQNVEISQLICYHGGLFQGDAKNALLQLSNEYK